MWRKIIRHRPNYYSTKKFKCNFCKTSSRTVCQLYRVLFVEISAVTLEVVTCKLKARSGWWLKLYQQLCVAAKAKPDQITAWLQYAGDARLPNDHVASHTSAQLETTFLTLWCLCKATKSKPDELTALLLFSRDARFSNDHKASYTFVQLETTS